MSKINVDPKKCIGCGLCTSIAEECFRINDQGKAEAIENCVENKGCETCDCPGCDDKIKEAAESCPVQAITSAD